MSSHTSFIATIIVAALVSTGCASTTNVKPVDQTAHKIDKVCIIKNPKVIVGDMVPVIQDGFSRHGIPTQLIEAPTAANCAYTLNYTARQEWDFNTFLSYARMDLLFQGQAFAYVEYDHSGFDSKKWASTATKLDPLIDQLLVGFTGGPIKSDQPVATTPKTDVYAELIKLDELRAKGIITQAEFDAQKQKILASTK